MTTQTAQADKNELQILFPTAELTIGGEKIEIKEYTLKQQLQHNAKFVPFIASLRATLGNSQEDFNLDALMMWSPYLSTSRPIISPTSMPVTVRTC